MTFPWLEDATFGRWRQARALVTYLAENDGWLRRLKAKRKPPALEWPALSLPALA